MTVLIGVLSSGGVVLGADGSVTLGASDGQQVHAVVEQPGNKLAIIDDQIAVACTGGMGLSQWFVEIVRDVWRSCAGKTLGPFDVAAQIRTRALQKFQTASMELPLQLGALMAFPLGGTPYLAEFAYGTLIPEFKTLESVWYGSMGSGQLIADPFLGFLRGVFWRDGAPSLASAKFACIWALSHAIEVNPGGINDPVKIAVVKGNAGRRSAVLLQDAELQEHRQHIEEMKEAMRRAHLTPAGVAAATSPPDPPPR